MRDLERPVGFIPQRIFSRGPIPLIAPFLKISIGAPWQKDLPCLFKIGACFVEGPCRAALMFARVRAGIKAGNPFPGVTGVRIARIDYNLLCLAERRSEAIPSQGAVKGSFQKEGVTLMIRPLLLSVLTCTLLLWNAGARAETKPSPNAVVKCGRLAGLKNLPGWQTPAIYKIEGNKVTFERIPTSGDETEAWSGVKGQSGQIMLVGAGGNKSDQWVMEFSGKWAGGNKTKLTGKFTNTSGSSGYRICTINL